MRTAIVTGGGTGLGRATAEVLVESGLNCAIVGRRQDRLDETAAKIAAKDRLLLIEADVTRAEDRERIRDETVRAFGQVDILVNNAGISRPGPLLHYSEEDWERIFRTNVEACFFMAQAVIPLMKHAGFGRIINIASVYGSLGLNAPLYAGLHPEDVEGGPTRNPAYHSSKGALINLTRDLAIPVARWGITVNTLSPGMFITEQSQGIVNEEVITNLSRMTPVGRFGQPREVGYAVRFLASDEASFVTGINLIVDGGWSIW
jgi:NAD(P)-dependent dehydrogenase (short-subunit alcohol dehydrogenase family)